ncbi:alpha/beta fold hydrolase [Streptomyces sp. NBC_01235]|uniref:alpha/beta fold hydrolase n=1 Tax=Streptomyces sp. NBC_01235 TaxID=2903788 RepID=UPI002E101F46|nr:alpha/beta hydrolase [Streptomyces sp. NBC_01235]
MGGGVSDVDGTGLYHEVRGIGPALLMIGGPGGDAGYCTVVAEDLADACTVITHDRRGNSRSQDRTDRDGGPTRPTEQASGARALIDGPAGGRAPVRRETSRGEGAYRWPADLWQRFLANPDHLFGTVWEAFAGFRPDEAAPRTVPFPILLAAGTEDRGTYCVRPSIGIARRIGAPWAESPGVRMEFTRGPARPASRRPRVAATQMRTARVPGLWVGVPERP